MPRTNEDVLDQDANDLEEQDTSIEETQEENDNEEEGTESADSEEGQDETSEEDGDSDDDGSSEDSDEGRQPKKPRPVFTMPVSKATKEKEKAVEKARAEAKAEAEREYQEKLNSLQKEYESKVAQGQSTSGLDEKLRKFAEEKGLDADAAKGLLDIFKESIQLPDMSRYDELVKAQEIEQHKAQVNSEIDDQVIPLIKKDFPSASAEHINKVKQEIAKLAFTKRFNTYSVADIYIVNRGRFEFKNGHTAEDSSGRTVQTDSLEGLSEEEAMKLSAEDYTRWQDLQASKQSRYVD